MQESNAPTANGPIWLADSAELYGDIRLHEGVSVWPKVVMRAESDYIEIGAFTNIQDFTMIHIADCPTIIGAYCSITHHCTIHGATIGDNCLIGINATIMDRAVIGDNCIIAGHTIVTEDTVIPPNSIVAGARARLKPRATTLSLTDSTRLLTLITARAMPQATIESGRPGTASQDGAAQSRSGGCLKHCWTLTWE